MSITDDLQALPSRLSRSLQRHAALRRLPGPETHLISGNVRQLRPAMLATQLGAWSDEYGPIYRCRAFHRSIVVVGGASLVRDVLRQRPQKVRRIDTMESVAQDLGINGVFSAEGDDWRRQRRLVMSAFGRSKVADMQASVAMVTERLLAHWEGSAGRPRDVFPDLTRFTADVTTLVAFGYDLDSLRTSAELQRSVTTVFDGLARRLYSPVPYWRWFKLPHDHRTDRALESLRATVQEILREGDSKGGPDNLLKRLQHARLEEEGSRRGLSEEEVFANVMTMLFAGEDTTANTLAWMFHFLATHPQVQDRMRHEAEEVLGDKMVVDDPGTAQALRYIEAAFVETLRLRPVVPVMFLQAREELSLHGYEIPVGTQMFVLLSGGAREAERFPDPEAFVPERWTEGKIDSARPAEGVQPFGGGPRVCPGRALAALEVQTLLGSVLRRFEVLPVPSARPPKVVASFTWGPDRIDVILKPL